MTISLLIENDHLLIQKIVVILNGNKAIMMPIRLMLLLRSTLILLVPHLITIPHRLI